jgi:hypothetical protein
LQISEAGFKLNLIILIAISEAGLKLNLILILVAISEAFYSLHFVIFAIAIAKFPLKLIAGNLDEVGTTKDLRRK